MQGRIVGQLVEQAKASICSGVNGGTFIKLETRLLRPFAAGERFGLRGLLVNLLNEMLNDVERHADVSRAWLIQFVGGIVAKEANLV
jgi:hypothetical protein